MTTSDPAHYESAFTVRTADVDLHGRIQAVIFLDYLLDAAGAHAAALGLSVHDMVRQGLTWVLSRFHVRILRYPRFGEPVAIRTWPTAQHQVFALRDFEASDAAGPIAAATSSWLVLDLKSRRPIRFFERLPAYPSDPRRAIADGFEALPGPSREDATREFPVFSTDIDFNRHVTSSVYVHRALETVPREILFGFRPEEIEVNYRAEAFYGDGIRSVAESVGGADAPRFLHRLTRAADGRELALLRTGWKAI